MRGKGGGEREREGRRDGGGMEKGRQREGGREAVNLVGWGGEYTVHYMLEVLTSSCKKRK